MKVLAFDLGNVLFDFDYNLGLDKIKNRVGVSPDVIIEALFFKNFSLDFEKGLVSEKEFFLKFKKAFSGSLSFSEFIEAWSSIFSPNSETIALVKTLRLKYPVYLISNICKLHYDYLYKNHREVFDLFKGLILSFKVKSVKPEKKIYQILKETAGTQFNNIIYIDDRQDLIQKAKTFGLCCIKFINNSQLVEELQKLGINS
ncbi:MAG: hypothetical protein NG737_03255 [Omnitrophica bacterium]|nr:hypothetical protein [Candidatus Omnitrophota bacterium]